MRRRDWILSRLQRSVRAWEEQSSWRFRRLARVAEYVIIPDYQPVWDLDYSARTWAGAWTEDRLTVSPVTRGPGRDLVAAVEEVEGLTGIRLMDLWTGGLLYQGRSPPVASFGARWISGSDRISLSVPAV